MVSGIHFTSPPPPAAPFQTFLECVDSKMARQFSLYAFKTVTCHFWRQRSNKAYLVMLSMQEKKLAVSYKLPRLFLSSSYIRTNFQFYMFTYEPQRASFQWSFHSPTLLWRWLTRLLFPYWLLVPKCSSFSFSFRLLASQTRIPQMCIAQLRAPGPQSSPLPRSSHVPAHARFQVWTQRSPNSRLFGSLGNPGFSNRDPGEWSRGVVTPENGSRNAKLLSVVWYCNWILEDHFFKSQLRNPRGSNHFGLLNLPPAPRTRTYRKKGFSFAGLIEGNQWLISP